MRKPAQLALIAHDQSHEADNWKWFALLQFDGHLDMENNRPSEAQEREIYSFLAENHIFIQSAGSGMAGQPFANEPYIDVFNHQLIVSQSGGLDI